MSGSPEVAAINAALRGATELLGLQLTHDSGKYQLMLSLGRVENGKLAITLVCRDVQNFELNPTGDGFEQLLHLHVEDLSSDGLDRIKFSIEELERETLFLHCSSIQVIRPA